MQAWDGEMRWGSCTFAEPPPLEAYPSLAWNRIREIDCHHPLQKGNGGLHPVGAHQKGVQSRLQFLG